MESYTDPTPSAQTTVEPLAEETHRGKATTAMVLSIIGLALVIIPGFNLGGLVLSIIGLCMSVKNRKFAAASGIKENSNNTVAFTCGLIGVIINGLLFLLILVVIILALVFSVAAVTAVGPAIGDIITENAPAVQDALESMLPIVESAITGLAGLL